jgi:hypothetical protein
MPQPHDERLFHRALRACMSEGRAPSERELELTATKIWQDSYRAATGLEWSEVEPGSFLERRTIAAARAALGIANSFWAELAAA